jgi:hypothetical protein
MSPFLRDLLVISSIVVNTSVTMCRPLTAMLAAWPRDGAIGACVSLGSLGIFI